MELTRHSPMRMDIKVVPWSTIICELEIKGTKKPIKINIDTHVYYKNSIHSNRIDIINSGTQSIYTSTKNSTHIIKMDIPYFTNCTKSYVYISIDPTEELYAKIFILRIIIDEKNKYEIKKRNEEDNNKIRLDRLKNRLAKGEIDVECKGLMLGDSGFAKAMRNITLGLNKIGCNVRPVPIDKDNINLIFTEQGKSINNLIIANSIDPYFFITMNDPMSVIKESSGYSIGYVMFETETFPYKYVQHLIKLDEIWTPSTFCKNSMEKSGLKNVIVMPFGVDIYMFNPENVDPLDLKLNNVNITKFIRLDNSVRLDVRLDNRYKFLSVCGYSERKGMSILIRSYAEEFNGNDNVILYIKGGWYPLQKAREEINNLIKDIRNPPLIHLDFNIYPDNILARLYKACDCFVLPTRGEGWCLPLTEAMSMELPTIATRWGGQLDFMNDDNSYLIDIEGIGMCKECDWICTEYVGEKFAIPSKAHLKNLLRYVYNNKDEAVEKGRIARKYIVKNFSWEESCNKMYRRLKYLAHDMTKFS